jgi:uncharacterized protein YdhG (YjbR/CyaY superfamily)
VNASRSTATTASRTKVSTSGFTDAERAAMKERADELRNSGRGGKKKSDDANALLAKIAEMPDDERALAERVHAIVASVAPHLSPKTWYGMPAYADQDGKIVVFFQGASKFEARYSTLGFNDTARLDDGRMWPTSFAITSLTDSDVRRIEELVKRAVG